MQNEIYRKYTSITLMAIMVAGGLTFAVPGADPVFAEVSTSNPHLYVSAEGQDPDNMFAQGNIIEVIVRDDTIGDTDEGEAEPEVTVNGADLRMLQTANGDWRAYFAEVDALEDIDGDCNELDYGVFYDAAAATTMAGGNVDLTDSDGAYFPPPASCMHEGEEDHPLIRETRDLTTGGNGLGQLDLSSDDLWPFIQVFDFTSLGDVEIVYNKGGTREAVTLTFDDPSESHTIDRQKYPQRAHVHLELMDYALNIDPTDEDTWVFDTQNGAAYYNLFDEDGTPVNAMRDTINAYDGDAGIDETVSIDRGAQGTDVIKCQVTGDFGIKFANDASQDYLISDDNGACVPNAGLGAGASDVFEPGNFAIGFVEDGSNNNVFINYAEDQRSNIVVKKDALRGNSFEVDYSSPDAKSGVIGHFFAEFSLDVPDDIWNSGERIPITLTDMDANVNPLAEDDLTVANPYSLLVPAIQIGSPVTLRSATGPVVWFDLSEPTITLNGRATIPLVQGGTYIEQGAACVDGGVTTAATVSGSVDEDTVDTYTITYTCASGLETTRTVTVTEADTTGPMIILNDGPEKVVQGGNYVDPGAICDDDVDADKAATPSGLLDTSQLGDATIVYTCADSSGNPAAPVTRTVEVVVQDNEMPTIELNEGTNTAVQNRPYTDPGATCVDNVDGMYPATTTDVVDTSQLGQQTITYTCEDSSGNNADPVTRTVTVEPADETAPTITLNGESIVRIVRGSISAYDDPGAVCSDIVDGDRNILGVGTVDTNRAGTYTLTYTCTDSSGNPATSMTRTITVGLPVVLTSIAKGNAGWVDGAYDLKVTGTISSDERDIVLDTDDIPDFDPEPVPTNDDGSIDTTVLLTDIRASGDITFTLAASDGSEESNPVTVRNIPSILRLGAITAGDWVIDNGPKLALTITGSEGVGSAAYQVDLATAADPETSLIDTIEFGAETQIMRNLTTTAITGPTQFVLVATDNDGVVTMSGARTADIPPVLTATIVRADAWDNGILKLTITGQNNTDLATYTNAALLYDDNVQALTVGTLAADGSSTNTVEVNSTGIFGTVDFNDISTAGDSTELQLVFDTQSIDDNTITTSTTQIESPAASMAIPAILQLDRLDIASTWAEGSLGLRVAGSEGVGSSDAVVLDAPDVEGFTAIPITQTDGTIQDIVSTTHIALSGDTVFRLQGTSGTNEAYSNNMTIRIPPALTLTGIDRDGTWNEGSLTLNVNGTEMISGDAVDVFYQVGSTWTDAGVDVTGTDGTISSATVTFTDISVSGDTVFRLQSGTSGNIAVSNTGTVNIPPILTLSSATNPTWNDADTALTFSLDGMESVSGTTVTFQMLNMEGAVLGAEDTTVASTGGTIFTQATITGLDAATVGSTAMVRLTSGAASSSNLTVTNIPANFTSQSVDMTPTPIVQHNSGFPPITKAVINGIGDIPAVHNVALKPIPTDKTIAHTWSGNDMTVEQYSDRLRLYEPDAMQLDAPVTGESAVVVHNWQMPTFSEGVTTMFNWNVESLAEHAEVKAVYIANSTHKLLLSEDASGLMHLDKDMQAYIEALDTDSAMLIVILDGDVSRLCSDITLVADFFTFGNGVNNAIYRIEVEEASSNSDTFEGTIEYTMLNQLNVEDPDTYNGLRAIGSDVSMIVDEDFTDEDSVRVNYLDLGADGVSTQIAIQQAAPTHSAVVSFDAESYKIADTVTITLEDSDLNVKNDVIDIYTVPTVRFSNGAQALLPENYPNSKTNVTEIFDPPVDDKQVVRFFMPMPFDGTPNDPVIVDFVGAAEAELVNSDTAVSITKAIPLLDVTFDDELWTTTMCWDKENARNVLVDGFASVGLTLQETTASSGVFTGDFQIPETYCQKNIDSNNGTYGQVKSTTGVDIEVNYQDFRDASGEEIEVGAGAAVRANTGTVSLDRTVYPVPFAGEVFKNANGDYLGQRDLTVHVTIDDPDFDVSAAGEDKVTTEHLTVQVIRGSAIHTINLGDHVILETAPDSGAFELDLPISYSTGPWTPECQSLEDTLVNKEVFPRSVLDISPPDVDGLNGCILQGDILQVEYRDPTDASGEPNTVTDSATFDLRNGVLQSDKSVYIIGSDMILTLIEPDFDLENDGAESYPLDLIEWDSDAATIALGQSVAFDPEPSVLRETGDSTGIFQVIVEIPAEIGRSPRESRRSPGIFRWNRPSHGAQMAPDRIPGCPCRA